MNVQLRCFAFHETYQKFVKHPLQDYQSYKIGLSGALNFGHGQANQKQLFHILLN